MNNVIKVSEEEHFAEGQGSCDLQVNYDARDVEAQDALDSEYEFFRFLRASTGGIANNEPR
jgi:hypothetical protein